MSIREILEQISPACNNNNNKAHAFKIRIKESLEKINPFYKNIVLTFFMRKQESLEEITHPANTNNRRA